MSEQRDRWIDIEALMGAGEDDGYPAGNAWRDLAEIKEELERLSTEGTPGVVHKIDKAFYELAIKERDYECHVADDLREELERLRKDRANILAQSDERWRKLDRALSDLADARKEIKTLSEQLKHVRAENRYLVFGDDSEEALATREDSN